MKKLVVFGWLATAGMTLYDVFRKREDEDSIWSAAIELLKDNFALDITGEKITEAIMVACVILAAPVFAVLKVIALIRMAMAAVN